MASRGRWRASTPYKYKHENRNRHNDDSTAVLAGTVPGNAARRRLAGLRDAVKRDGGGGTTEDVEGGRGGGVVGRDDPLRRQAPSRCRSRRLR